MPPKKRVPKKELPPERRRGVPKFETDAEGYLTKKGKKQVNRWYDRMGMEEEDKILLKSYGEDGLSDFEIDQINVVLLTTLIPTKREDSLEQDMALGQLRELRERVENPEEYYDEDGNNLVYEPTGFNVSDSDDDDDYVYNPDDYLTRLDDDKPDAEGGSRHCGGSFVQPVNTKFLPFF